MSLNDNSKILEKKMMKTKKKRKALWIHDQKKTMVTMVVMEVLVEVVLSVVLLLVKKWPLKVEVAVLVEMVARAEVVVLILVEKSWGQGEIC